MRLHTAVMLSLIFAASVVTASASDLVGLVNEFDHLTIEAASTSISNVVLNSGRLKLQMAQGSVAIVKAGEHPVGVFFSGVGSFAYVVDDPVEFAIARRSLRFKDLQVCHSKSHLTRTGQSLHNSKRVTSRSASLHSDSMRPRPV